MSARDAPSPHFAMRRQRTVDARAIQAGRFRPETIQRSDRPRLAATLGERALAKQLQRLEAQRREE